jgi:DnaK suppressor protein
MSDDVRQRLEDIRTELTERVDALSEPPELGSAQGFGKRIGDGTTEAIRRLTDIGVGSSFEERLDRVERALEKLDEDTYGTATPAARRFRSRACRRCPTASSA